MCCGRRLSEPGRLLRQGNRNFLRCNWRVVASFLVLQRLLLLMTASEREQERREAETIPLRLRSVASEEGFEKSSKP